MAGMVRSFIAFDLDSETIVKRLTDVQASLARTGADLKLVEPENIHITMRFLGDIAPTMIDRIFEEMKLVKFVPFDVKIHGVGAFPDSRHARVLWAGMVDGADELRGIFNQLEPRIRNLGFTPDSKGFSPHLTIARVKSGKNKTELAKRIEEKSNQEFGTIRAECLRLKRSDLTPKGPIYSTLKEYCPQK